tara:strand:- start:2640 stop:2843 length:204 start_codon:yes stop_codon:yes gene_type:complete
MQKVTIFGFLGEIRTYTLVEESTMIQASSSKITTTNNKDFKDLVSSWIDGAYDEDPESLAWEIKNLM